MKVTKISEENYELIGIVIDYEPAWRYVVEHGLDDSSDVIIRENETEYAVVNVVEHFGENWREKLCKRTFENSEKLFTD